MEYSKESKSYAEKLARGARGNEESGLVRGLKSMFGSNDSSDLEALKRRRKEAMERSYISDDMSES